LKKLGRKKVEDNLKKRLKRRFRLSKLSLNQILINKSLASFGDALVNFIYSLALSDSSQEPAGAKVKSRVLAESLRRAGLRKHLPNRSDRHSQGDAAEAFIAYAWLQNAFNLEEATTLISTCLDDPVEAFSKFLELIKTRLMT
jgi:hypothetical protein